MSAVRRFVLVRKEDVSGSSGTGIVAWGVEYPDLSVQMRWLPGKTGYSGFTAYAEGIAAVVANHGHDGRTEVRWIDSLLGQHDFKAELDYIQNSNT